MIDFILTLCKSTIYKTNMKYTKRNNHVPLLSDSPNYLHIFRKRLHTRIADAFYLAVSQKRAPDEFTTVWGSLASVEHAQLVIHVWRWGADMEFNQSGWKGSTPSSGQFRPSWRRGPESRLHAPASFILPLPLWHPQLGRKGPTPYPLEVGIWICSSVIMTWPILACLFLVFFISD